MLGYVAKSGGMCQYLKAAVRTKSVLSASPVIGSTLPTQLVRFYGNDRHFGDSDINVTSEVKISQTTLVEKRFVGHLPTFPTSAELLHLTKIKHRLESIPEGRTLWWGESSLIAPNSTDKPGQSINALNHHSSSDSDDFKRCFSQDGVLSIPLRFQIKPSIGIPPEMIERSLYRTPLTPDVVAPIEIPTSQANVNKEIEDSPNSGPPTIEKQAARLVVIRRIKMNKHKLRKLRKRMKYVWAKVKLRRGLKKERAYLDSKMELIKAARQFDAKEYVAGIIKRAKEEPIPRRWQDPLMPEWYKEQEMKKEAWAKRYQKIVNLYVNRPITIDFRDKKK